MEKSINIYEESRPWGNFRKFTENINSTVKIITVSSNKKLSLQSHTKRAEFWRVLDGEGYFLIDEIKVKVTKGYEQYVPIGAKHRIEANEKGLVILEIGIGQFDEKDIVRYEDDFGRV